MVDPKHTDASDDGGWSVDEYAEILGISRSLLYSEVRAKRLRLAKIRTRSIVTRTEGRRYQQLLDREAAEAAAGDTPSAA